MMSLTYNHVNIVNMARREKIPEHSKEQRDTYHHGDLKRALTEAALGHAAAARSALNEAIRRSPLLERDPVEFWARFQASPDVIARLNAGLAKAGLRLPPPSTSDTSPRS